MIFLALGIIAALGALFVQLIITEFAPSLMSTAIASAGTLAGLIVLFALIEEAAKLWAVRKLAKTQSSTKSKIQPLRKLVTNAMLIGVGFVIVEFALIALTPYTSNPFSGAMFFGAPIIHLTSPVMIALTLRALSSWQPWLALSTALTIATLIHASYNLLASTQYAPTNTISIIFTATIIIATIGATIGATRKN